MQVEFQIGVLHATVVFPEFMGLCTLLLHIKSLLHVGYSFPNPRDYHACGLGGAQDERFRAQAMYCIHFLGSRKLMWYCA